MTMTTDRKPPPSDEQIDDFPHDDVLDMRDLLDDEDVAPVLVAAMLEDGLASDVDDVRQYAENEPTMVEDNYFEDYARELADDLGLVHSGAGWPNSYIDWTRAAEALLQDYSAVDIAGRRYWVRSY